MGADVTMVLTLLMTSLISVSARTLGAEAEELTCPGGPVTTLVGRGWRGLTRSESFTSPHTSPSSVTCQHRLVSTSRSRRLVLEFERFHLTRDCSAEFVDVYDGAERVARYCGNRLPPSPPDTYVSSGSNVTLHFRLSAAGSSGFRIGYSLKSPFQCKEGSRTKRKVVRCDPGSGKCSVHCNLENYFPTSINLTSVECSSRRSSVWKSEARNMCKSGRSIARKFHGHTVCPDLVDLYMDLLEPVAATSNPIRRPKVMKCSKVCERRGLKELRYATCRHFDGACRWKCVKNRYLIKKC